LPTGSKIFTIVHVGKLTNITTSPKWIEYREEDQGQVLRQEGESVDLLDDCCRFIPSSLGLMVVE
jgi:hypothetical protein